MDQADIFRFDLPGKYKYLNIVGAALEAIIQHMDDLATPAATIYNVQLAVHEICNNIIEHAYGHEEGQIKLVFCLEYASRRFVVDLYDTGRVFDLSTVPELNLAEPQEEGYGLFLVRQLMDEVIYEPQLENNHWRLVKNL